VDPDCGESLKKATIHDPIAPAAKRTGDELASLNWHSQMTTLPLFHGTKPRFHTTKFADRNSQVKANRGQFPAFTECRAYRSSVNARAELRSKTRTLTTFFVAGETLRGTFYRSAVCELQR
jgi:hypothetical protein